MIQHPAFPVEPWAVRETELDLDRLAQTESVFALANGHSACARTSTRASRSVCPAPISPASTRCGRCRTPRPATAIPEAGQTVVNVTNGKIIRLLVEDEPFDVRYGELRKHERVLDLRAGVLRRTAEWMSPTGRARAGLVDPDGVVLAAGDRGDPLRGRAARRRGAGRRPVRARRQRDAAGDRARIRGRPRRSRRRWRPSTSTAKAMRAVLVHTTKRSGLRVAAAMDHGSTVPRTSRRTIDELPRPRARARSPPTVAPGTPLRVDEVRRATGGRATRTVPALRDQVERGAGRGRPHRLGRAARASSARYLDDFWERADIEIDGDAELQQARALRALSHAPGGGARRAARDPGEGPDRPGLRRPHVLGHRGVRAAACSPTPRPAPRRDALRWRHQTLDLARERARSLGLRGRVPVADDRRPGVLGLLARGHGGVPHQRGDRRCRDPLPGGSPRTRRSSARPGSSCSSRPRGCGARSATTTPGAASGSTASPGPTSTARSPTTTSTRT